MQSFKELIVWQRAMQLVKSVYLATEKLPKAEYYELRSQMRRAAVSIPSNISEGYKRSTTGEYVHFLGIADASAAELETQMILCKELCFDLDLGESESLLIEVQKMLTVLKWTLKSKSTKR